MKNLINHEIVLYPCSFYFNFSATYVGVGMICPTVVSISMLAGSILSSGIMLPYIESKKGVWYNSEYKESSMMGIYGYKVIMLHFSHMLSNINNIVNNLTTN